MSLDDTRKHCNQLPRFYHIQKVVITRTPNFIYQVLGIIMLSVLSNLTLQHNFAMLTSNFLLKAVQVATHQSVNNSSNCSVEHMQPRDLLSDTRKAFECEISHRYTLVCCYSSHRETRVERINKRIWPKRPHILEGEDDDCNCPSDHEQNGSNTEKSPAGGEVHLWWETSH